MYSQFKAWIEHYFIYPMINKKPKPGTSVSGCGDKPWPAALCLLSAEYSLLMCGAWPETLVTLTDVQECNKDEPWLDDQCMHALGPQAGGSSSVDQFTLSG